MIKKKIKKLTLSKESLMRLEPAELRRVAGGATLVCTHSNDCTDSCVHTCPC